MSSLLARHVWHAWCSVGSGPPGLVVALSGGADSVALTRALLEVRPANTPLVLAHLNHLLRGAESDADEAFVRDLHASLATSHLQFVCHRLDIAALTGAERGNLESVARRERYRWLAEVARTHGLTHVATAHTANDQAETVLHRLLRGTGIEGLRGIASQRPLEAGVTLVRPMLGLQRKDVEAYLAHLGQAARYDTTNDDVRLTRNRIRKELIPLLEERYNPRTIEILNRLAAQAEEWALAEEVRTARVFQEAELPRAGEMIVLEVARLRQERRHRVRSVMRSLWQREGWPMNDMGYRDYDRVAGLTEAVSGAMDLPGGVHVRRLGMVLQLRRDREK